jgi:copper chaperone NosL
MEQVISKSHTTTVSKERVQLPSLTYHRSGFFNQDLRTGSRLLIVLLSLSMCLAYFFPLWEIYLDAPQYPEGLGMTIWLNKLGGDINTINGLNHYIGMKHIDANSFKELVWMPYIVGFLIALGLITALANRKYMLVIFVLFIIVLGTVGATDFYLWEYDYGHDLDPRAAIKVPGMSYQPPLIGSKQLLNFTATSIPGIGGFAVMGAGVLAALLLVYELKSKRTEKKIFNS